MKKVIFGAFLLSCAAMMQSCGDNNEKQDSVDSAKSVNKVVKPVEKDASDFAVNAANGGLMEVKAGKLASEQGMNPRVKAFGEMMVKDHSEANEKLKGLSSSLNIALPDSLSDDSQKEIDKLAKKRGRDFDKAYMDMMVDDHKKDVAEFRKAADKCSDSTLRDFATKTLPVLEKHLDSAQAITAKK